MYVSSWKIVGCIPTVKNEYIVLGFDPESPTPYATWSGIIEGERSDFYCGNYFETKKEAVKDLIERAKPWL